MNIHPQTKRKIPMGIWHQSVNIRNGKTLVRPQRGPIQYMNCLYREVVLVINEIPTAVPWQEFQPLQKMKYSIYNYGGMW